MLRLAVATLACSGCLLAPDRPSDRVLDAGPDAPSLSCDVITGATLNVATTVGRKGLTVLVRGGERNGRSFVTLHEPGPQFSTRCPTAVVDLPEGVRVRALTTRPDANRERVYVLSDGRAANAAIVHVLEVRDGTLHALPDVLTSTGGLTTVASASGPERPAFITTVAVASDIEVVFGGGPIFRGRPGTSEPATAFSAPAITQQRWYTAAELSLDPYDLVTLSQPVVARVMGPPTGETVDPLPSDGVCVMSPASCAGLVGRNVTSGTGAVAYTLTRLSTTGLLHLVAVYDATSGAKRGTAQLADPAEFRVIDVVLDHHSIGPRDEAFVLTEAAGARSLYVYPDAIAGDAHPNSDGSILNAASGPVPATSTHLVSGTFVPDGPRRVYVLADRPDRDDAEPCFTGTGLVACDGE